MIRTKEHAAQFIDEILESIKNDVGSALAKYQDLFINDNIMCGFFSIPRMLFPEIDNIGAYFAGTINGGTAKNAINFMKQYFGRVNHEYVEKSAFIYTCYRHGLIHQHIPKTISCGGKTLGWQIGVSLPDTMSSHLKVRGGSITIDGQIFYEDAIGAINEYKNDMLTSNNSDILDNFIKAHDEILKPEDINELKRKHSYLVNERMDFTQ